MARTVGNWISWASRALAREWRTLEGGSLHGMRTGVATTTETRPLSAVPASLATDGEVVRALSRLRESSGWERLEIGRRPDNGLVYGHCMTASRRSVELAEDPPGPESPEVIRRLQDLFLACGWQRLEAVSNHRGGTGGFCERADGSGVSYPGRHERGVTKVTSVDHPGVIHVATGPVRWEDPGDGCQ